MKLPLYQVDAFADRLFSGNPAAVVPLEAWLSAELMQAIAAENNLAETAFFVAEEQGYRIRWFTPTTEVDLCGHATLASAYVLFHELGFGGDEIHFNSQSGELRVWREQQSLSMDFPSRPPRHGMTPEPLIAALGRQPQLCLRGQDYVAVFGSAQAIRDLRPDMTQLRQLDLRGVIATAPGEDCDFVCRFFAPRYGIPEDPVTGSAYTQLAPYWAKALNQNRFRARQLSARGGQVDCELRGDRVVISGTVIPYLQGEITLPDVK